MEDILQKHKSHFPDIPSLYGYQEDVLAKLQNGVDTLAIIPTGGGKSLIYQLMALELPGITLVISPLLALMEEQVNELNKFRNIPSLAINSTIPFEEQRKILRRLDQSHKLIYIAPERLQNPFFRAALVSAGLKISLIVVDEAHCISQWGSSFRPDYGQINGFLSFLRANANTPMLLCLTATLSQAAREDILQEFLISNDDVVIRDNIRENLILTFEEVTEEKSKNQKLYDFLKFYKPNKTIVYLYSKKKCEVYAKEFSDNYRTAFYHSGLEAQHKTKAYEDFITGKVDILFATTAFGMGINIPDIDGVVQLQIPNSIEEYYQQVGRGWRKKDVEKECHCLAVWSTTNFDRRRKEILREKYTVDLITQDFSLLIGGVKIKKVGQIVNRDKDAISNSDRNLNLLKYKLELHGLLKTVGELNGSPLTIQMHKDTEFWKSVKKAANETMDSFVQVCRILNITIDEIIRHLYEEDLKGNIKKLPAMKKDVFFELQSLELNHNTVQKIVEELNEEVDFRVARLDELQAFFNCDNKAEMLRNLLS